MLMHPYNELLFKATIESTSPVLVRESRYTEEDKKQLRPQKDERKGMPDAIPMSRATRQEIEEAVVRSRALEAVQMFEFFLPGSTLRGVARSHLERTLRGLNSPDSPRVCDPFEEDLAVKSASCSKALTERRERTEKDFRPYAVSCPVCRLFGSTLQGSRISFTDARRVEPSVGRVVQREHVKINRRTGAVGGPPITFFGLYGMRFEFEMRLRNFELSQVVLAGLLLTDLQRGNVPIGSGKSKGYGRVKLHRCGIQLSYFGDFNSEEPPPELRGVAEHQDPGWSAWFQKRYRVVPQTPVQLSAADWKITTPWLRTRDIRYEEFQTVWPKLNLGWSNTLPLDMRMTAEA